MKIQENHTVREMTPEEEAAYREEAENMEPDAEQTIGILFGGDAP